MKPDSRTETYAAVELYVNNWRWAGVPFFIRTGKHFLNRLQRCAYISSALRRRCFPSTPYDQLGPNVITLRIQPDDGIGIAFDAKRPGTHMRALTVEADFSYETVFGSKGPPAYETLLLDSMRGDATLFTRRDEVEAEWRIITPIEEAWAQMPAPKFPNYTAGSEGPAEAGTLIASGKDGESRAWRRLSACSRRATVPSIRLGRGFPHGPRAKYEHIMGA